MDFTKVPDGVDHLAEHDPGRERFGAATHAYRFAQPLTKEELREIESRLGYTLPEDYASFLLHCGNGGAGPFHGIFPVRTEHAAGVFPAEHVWNEPTRAGFMASASEAGTIALSNMGCGYFAILIGQGPARGQVWEDLRGCGLGYVPMFRSFGDYYGEWIRRLTLGETLQTSVGDDLCGFPQAVRGVSQLANIDVGALKFQACGSEVLRYYDEGDLMDMCPRCHALATRLMHEQGLRAEHFARPMKPKQSRT